MLPNQPQPHRDTPATTPGLKSHDENPEDTEAFSHCGETSAFLEVLVGRHRG